MARGATACGVTSESIVARARCSELLTEVTVVSSRSAASRAVQHEIRKHEVDHRA